MKRTLSAILVLCCFVSLSQPSAVQLTNGPTPNLLSSTPRGFFVFNTATYFTASNGTTGSEIWKTDGTSQNTALLKDINLGIGSSDCSNFLVFKNKMYFTASDGIHGYQLWQSDGTTEGTTMVTQKLHSTFQLMVVSGESIFILQTNGTRTLELWKSDGTSTGTTLVKGNIPLWNKPANLTSAFGLVFFSAQPEGTNYTKVWRSDGTEAGTFPITAELDGNGSGPNGSSHPTQFIEFKGRLYFIVRSQSFQNGLSVGIVKTDGSIAGTQFVIGIHDGNTHLLDYSDAIVHNDKMYFSFFDVNYNRYFIWESAGSAATTNKIYDQSSFAYHSPSPIFPLGNSLFFTSGNTSGGTSLTRFDLLSGISTQIKELSGPMEKPFIFFKDVDVTTLVAGKAGEIFIKHGPRFGQAQLWVSNGVAEGTVKLAGTSMGSNMVYNTKLFYGGAMEDNDLELWSTDGTTSGTSLVKHINTEASGQILGYAEMVKIGGRALFTASTTEFGNELWETDGTPQGTKMLVDKAPGNLGFFPSNFIETNGKIFFTGNPFSTRSEIFSTDGTAAGTVAVTDLFAGGARAFALMKWKENQILFWARKNDETYSLLKLDASLVVTELKNFGKNSYGVPWNLKRSALLNGVYYFTMDGEGGQLWKCDGTALGTVKVKDVLWLDEMTATSSHLFFTSLPYSGEQTLYRSDGTADGTVAIKSFGGSANETLGLFAFGDKLVFTARDAVAGKEIWMANGTDANATLLKDINPGADDGVSSPYFCVNDGKLFFAANDNQGAELWKTDGTAGGTVIVKDINPGAESSRPLLLTARGNKVYFSAYTPSSGFEVWRTDGSEEGTELVVDVIPGATYSNPRSFLEVNGRLIFIAMSESSGEQVYSYITNVTSVEEERTQVISVYPNPSQGIFRVDGETLEGYTLTVYSSEGNRVATQSSIVKDTVVDLQSHPSGLYVFRFTKNNKSLTFKVIKS